MCGRALKCIVDSLLLFLFSVQTLMLLSLTYRGYWELPSWVIEKAFGKHAPDSITVKVDTVRLYPRKGLEIRGVEFLSSECVCPLLSVERLLIVPSNPMIGKSESAVGLVQNASLYFPDPYLPESENLQLIRDLSLRFEVNRKTLVLQSFKGYLSELTFASLNPLELDIERIKNATEHSDRPKLTSEEIFGKLREIRFLHEYFEKAEDALLTVTFDDESAERQLAELNLYASSTSMMEDITTRDIYLTGTLVWDQEIYMPGVVSGEMKSMRFGDKLDLSGVAVELLYEKDDVFSIIPNRIRAHSASLSIVGRPFDYFSATVYPKNLQEGRIETGFGFGKQYVSTDSSYDLDLKTMQTSIQGDVNPILLAEDWLGPIEGMISLKFGSIPHVSASFQVKDWNRLEDVSFKIAGTQVALKDVPFEYARAKGRWFQEERQLFLDHFVASRSNYAIEGQLFRSLKTSEYRYLIDGTGLPPDLNPMFRPWWASTWEKFDFRNHPVGFDFDIWGIQKDESKRHVYGSMNFENIAYKGLAIDIGQVRLNAISKYIDLFDLYIQNNGNVASGRVQNVFSSTSSQQVSQHLDLYTDIPLHILAPAVGKDLDPFVKNTNPEAVAKVWVNGVVVKQEFPQFRYLDDLNIKLQVDQPTEFFGFELDRVEATVHKQQSQFVIDPVHFTFARGQGQAVFIASGPDEKKTLDFTVSVDDFDFREAIGKITAFQEDPEEATGDLSASVEEGVATSADDTVTSVKKTPESTGIQLKRPRDESYMDLVIKGSCPLDNLDGMHAVGSFELDDPLIHRVHIFGGFSKLMDNAELNLGSFSLKRATSPFEVDGRLLRLDDLELTGPSSRVKSKGTVNLEDGSLNFRLKAYPLGEVKFPVVAGLALVLRPFAHLFEVQLSGTFEDPEWKVVIDPSGL